ncbi:MAG: phage tail tape measure protein, partial [Rubrimonas sp.]
PTAIGDVAFQAANALVAGVEAMLGGAARGVDSLFAGLNAGLEALGVERRVALIGEVRLGRIDNPFAGAAAEAGMSARAAFEAAFAAEPIAVPDLGLDAAAEDAHAQAAVLRESLAGVAQAATAPLASLAALRDAMAGGAAETGAGIEASQAAAADLEGALDGAAETASRAGGAGRAAGAALASAAETATEAWTATTEAVAGAQESARETAQGLAQDIVGPIRDALKAGELSWRSFAGVVSSIAGNLANRLITVAFKPIETALVGALSGAFSGLGGGGLAGLFGFARGGAFAGGRELTAFARGGVVDRPTLFPLARGAGLMGEAGPEAILPLSRGRGGRLGVEVSRETQPAPEMSTRIINVLDPSVVGDYLATQAGERAILNVIRRNRSAIDG